MVIGEDIPLLIDDGAGAGGFGRNGIEEEIVSDGDAGDVDDAGIDALIDLDRVFLVSDEGRGWRKRIIRIKARTKARRSSISGSTSLSLRLGL
ncbi:MAG: hypothetical protein MPW14_01635 [Candidatus Manganitrophus sp.]|nr:MAG: hypothetical protein MPW14_01635 [Candidatus Manganitrophus sp.]